ncbi:MAG: hypothetical protein OEX22_00860, partial [Cyclobacteriaceae bacterium]|nr:hypothetical protein [Cyclobacteriaceae bacterium]
MSFLRKLSFFIFLGILFSPYSLLAQDDPKELSKVYEEQGDLTLAETRALDLARELYTLAADADPDNISGNFKAGNAFLQTVGKERAAKYLERVLAADNEYRFNILYLIGRSYQYGLDFDKALDYYNRYRTNLTQNEGYRG